MVPCGRWHGSAVPAASSAHVRPTLVTSWHLLPHFTTVGRRRGRVPDVLRCYVPNSHTV
jgi:hypothetical protein